MRSPTAGALQTPQIGGTAYTNSVAGATSTTLYAIDVARDVLVTLANPNDGIITTVGPLGVNTTADVASILSAPRARRTRRSARAAA